MDVVVDLEADVPGNPHMATEALALVSIEVQVRKLDQVPFGFGNGGSEDEGVVAVFAKVTIGPVQSFVVLTGLVEVGEAGLQFVSNVGLHGGPDFRKMRVRSLRCLPGGLCHYAFQMPSRVENFQDSFRGNKSVIQVEDASDDKESFSDPGREEL